MFNYQDLNDIEFEELCKDIMSKSLNTSLRSFAAGKDGGIDLAGTITGKNFNIIVQVKHYIKSTFSSLKNSLSKEISKVANLNPYQYYICCSQELTPNNIKDIYNMFSSYMASDKNIYTLKEIDSFLQDRNNRDILEKHYKLWLSSTTILDDINNNSIFIDCETLLSDIKEERKFFVQTTPYNLCKAFLKKHRSILLLGSPGVGKTTLSKMLLIYFADCDYRVRYTTNGDISDIKNALSKDKNRKEIILLDDCLGQYYFKLNDRQENEILSLLKYVKYNSNKLLILNSRITIFNEAKERSIEFQRYITKNEMNIYTLNMDKIPPLEKAKILYNHLTYNNISAEYLSSIKANKNYLKIVNHPNYTPRIIEYVTLNANSTITNNNYFEYVYKKLQNPIDIWKDEFTNKLDTIDRIFINTLYSLTDTNISSSILEECFEKRLSTLPNIDCTINNYEKTLKRLNQSIVKIIDLENKKHIGVINPSVNDYLKSIFFKNNLELNNIKNNIIYYEQLIRCYSKESGLFHSLCKPSS
ncbi:ATP-binding protein [Pectinatus frisingensis]|uniref:ATP-binding protein n=1 Tax=Pectinatus frisingensis TaxID=865 RepID=UPI0018C6CAED|nr:ATP-binding protein [Pectinatus frisingensis]